MNMKHGIEKKAAEEPGRCSGRKRASLWSVWRGNYEVPAAKDERDSFLFPWYPMHPSTQTTHGQAVSSGRGCSRDVTALFSSADVGETCMMPATRPRVSLWVSIFYFYSQFVKR